MKNLSDKHKSVHLRVVLPKDLREQLDEVRGNVPASAFVRDLIMKAVNYGNGQRAANSNRKRTDKGVFNEPR